MADEVKVATDAVKTAGKIAMSVAKKVSEMVKSQEGQSHMAEAFKAASGKDQGQGM